MLTLKINGESRSLGDIDPDTPLLWALRDTLGLVGTKYGCGIAQCGSCTVHVDGKPSRACVMRVGQLQGREIITIEGLARDSDTLHPLQQAWIDQDVAQCGYCQAGQIMSAAALLNSKPDPTDQEIETAMSGNLCRCGTYPRIVKAIKNAAAGGA
ncbi:MAG: 2Fe-2S iron-sulfur cluster binding domain-containing protein [Haliea sp.]|jgi:aerobic-type carbon monoxide dehydrogenase small subunit (CoxS/CutS family)|nr:2Fe-2S iron-sulfur cluster binding domain-containing protein [Haliea sp.]